MLELDLMQTLAFAGVALLFGHGLRRAIPSLERYGPAPRAFLVAPIVGAFFIDFTNAVIITLFLNLLA